MNKKDIWLTVWCKVEEVLKMEFYDQALAQWSEVAEIDTEEQA